MTEELLNRLRNTRSEREWGAICDEIKKNGGYPADWYAKVVLSGLMHRTSQSWR